ARDATNAFRLAPSPSCRRHRPQHSFPTRRSSDLVEKHGVTLIGYSNLPAMVATDASALYSRNVLDFMKLIANAEGQLAIQQDDRSEEHTSELQSRENLVCRLLLEKKKTKQTYQPH